ncbi:MAG: UvrD-helicase domain-containing protein [Treponema sp.]|nr:UvrD-helicase domain-containing protein [Treponema sp.]
MEEYKSQYPEKNMFIEASAGTGKTHTIISLVTQLTEHHVPLNKILIVTYTEKAAGELKDRIREALRQDTIDDAPIYTIHSFCQKTIEEFSFNARTASSQDMIDDGEIITFIEGKIRDELKDEEDFRFLYEHDDSFPGHLKNYLTNGVKKYYQSLSGKPVPEIVTLDTSDDDWDELKRSLDGANQTNKKTILGQMTKLYCEQKLPEFYHRWQQQKRQEQVQSFDDMLRTVREAVTNPKTGLKALLKEKYSYAIIDEFQDTNQKQWDIFTAIFADSKSGKSAKVSASGNDASGNDASDGHHLIVVGDPKQSIYAFQGANVQVYKNAVSSIKNEGGNDYSLSHNWRSSEQLIEAFNQLFSGDFFSRENCTYTPSFPPPDPERRIPAPQLYSDESKAWESVPPVWISSEGSDKDFAEAAVQLIIKCASFVPETKKTYLQIGSKKNGSYIKRSVSFKDFAILARTRPEMETIERELKATGIPFRRYKDDKLFATRECRNWISLFRAIASPDFTGDNRQILSECLFTDFFRPRRNAHLVQSQLLALEDTVYDSPDCRERRQLASWHNLAEKGRWAEFLEAIYRDTDIEKRFSQLDELDSLARYRQLGDYAVEYLYAHSCSLEDVTAHLERLSKKSEQAENDNSLLAKNTDFDCVQVMTIHASKGLEFPVVISAAGFKGGKTESQIELPCLFNSGSRSHLSFAKESKVIQLEEQQLEWERLYYVAYTRPTQLLVLPRYEQWIDKDGNVKAAFAFLKNSIDRLLKTKPQLCREFCAVAQKRADQKAAVTAILSNLSDENAPQAADEEAAAETQLNRLTDTKRKVAAAGLHQYSYSTLSKASVGAGAGAGTGAGTDAGEESQTDEGRFDSDGQTDRAQSLNLDTGAVQVPAAYRAGLPILQEKRYPKGKFIGIAVHGVFEHTDFAGTGNSTLEEALTDQKLLDCIEENFRRESISQKGLALPTAQAVWHTLNAELPEIRGNAATGASFTLSSIPETDRKAEIEFDLNPVSGSLTNKFCKGFIDLLFVREQNGEKVYSIVDWKSDCLLPEAYSDAKLLKEKVDKDYEIQRVLYSYSLITWLKQFYPADEYEAIFEKHFGGIYYVFFRGSHSGSGNGIYAQTWSSWSELKAAFDRIQKTLMDE